MTTQNDNSSKRKPFAKKLSLIKIQNCRPEVLEFARFMEMVLRENDHKGTWKNCTFDYLLEKLDEEVKELHECFWYPDSRSDYVPLTGGDSMPRWAVKSVPAIMREPGDVGNVAMFLFDNLKKECGGLP